MKRKFTLAFLVIASLMTTVRADRYETIVFKSVSGESYSVNTQDLEIYYKDGTMSFNNDERTIPISTLASMEFAKDPGESVAIEVIDANSHDKLTVYTVGGVKAGEFTSLAEAYGNLQPGIYIVRRSGGKTFKITVEL